MKEPDTVDRRFKMRDFSTSLPTTSDTVVWSTEVEELAYTCRPDKHYARLGMTSSMGPVGEYGTIHSGPSCHNYRERARLSSPDTIKADEMAGSC